MNSSGRKGKRPAVQSDDVDESYHQQPQLVKDHEGKLRRFKLSDEVVQQQQEQAGSSSAAAVGPVVFELVESAKMDILRSATAVLFGSPAVPQPAPAPAPAPAPPPPSDEPECVTSPEEQERARRGLVTSLTNQVTDLKKIKVEAVEAGEQARSRADELLERSNALVVQQQQANVERQQLLHRQQQMDAEKLALDAQLAEEVTCCICLETMAGAVTLSTCVSSHKFCDACIRGALGANPFCPQCRTPAGPESIQPDTVLRNLIAAFSRPAEA